MVPPPVPGGVPEAVAQVRVKATKAASLRVIWIIVFMSLFHFISGRSLVPSGNLAPRYKKFGKRHFLTADYADAADKIFKQNVTRLRLDSGAAGEGSTCGQNQFSYGRPVLVLFVQRFAI